MAFRRRIAGLAALTLLGLGPASGAGAGSIPTADPGLWNLAEPEAGLVGKLPDEPVGALAGAAQVLAKDVGVTLDDPLPALRTAHLNPALAGRLALLLQQLALCQDATDRLVAGLPAAPGELLARGTVPAGIPEAAELRTCAARVESGGLELERFLAAAPTAEGNDLDLWPVLRLDLDGSNDTVTSDYMLSVDTGGNDTYLNNAGGNLIDVRRGPPGSHAAAVAPARGCINPAYDLLAGECVISEALLIDVAGNDTYGHMEAPDRGLDGLCTNDPLVRRTATIGSGSWGVGILIDGAGDDHYLGKALTEGAGHWGGVGVLLDLAGNDSYSALRLAKGFGTLFGTGVFHDFGGNDTYSYYLPRPLDPTAEDRHPGAGGALDTGGTCDRIPRWEEGSAFLGANGIFIDDAGDDVYQAAPPHIHEPGASGFIRQTGSLGFGDGGFGMFIDGAGHDTYSGMPDRADGATVMPSDKSQGFFHDEGGAKSAAADPSPPSGKGSSALTAWFTHYIPSTVTIDAGGKLQFFNPDPYGGPLGGRTHSITELRSDGPPRFDVFVPWGMAADIGGVESLPRGRYAFACRIHPFMRGNLVVR